MNNQKNVFIEYGQNNTCFYYYLITDKSIEKNIFETLKQRKDYTEKLFEEDILKEEN